MMKIDRLIGILSILLQKEKVTAPYLAEKFEVSRRTINRDIEDLNRAGIPIVTIQGANGGISIMEGYKIDRALLTSSDMKAILAGLSSLDSVSAGSGFKQLMDKLQAGSSEEDHDCSGIRINLASWYRESLAPKIALIQKAVDEDHVIRFAYYGPNSEGIRELEPKLLLFQWTSWYVWGYCRLRGCFRMFKLSRMEALEITDMPCPRREEPERPPENNGLVAGEEFMKHDISVTALFDREVKWRLVEEYGIGSLEEQPDQTILMTVEFSEKEALLSWILSFREHVKIIEPEDMKMEFMEMLKRIEGNYF